MKQKAVKPKVNILLSLTRTDFGNDTGRTEEEQETILINAVAVTPRGDRLGEFQAHCKPYMYPELSEACVEVTGIRRDKIISAARFPTVYRQFTRWIGNVRDRYVKPDTATSEGFLESLVFPKDVSLVTWGKDTTAQLGRECRRTLVPFPFTSSIDLRREEGNLRGRPGKKDGPFPKLDLEAKTVTFLASKFKNLYERYRFRVFF